MVTPKKFDAEMKPSVNDSIIYDSGCYGTITCESGIWSMLPTHEVDQITMCERSYAKILNFDPRDFGTLESNYDVLSFSILGENKPLDLYYFAKGKDIYMYATSLEGEGDIISAVRLVEFSGREKKLEKLVKMTNKGHKLQYAKFIEMNNEDVAKISAKIDSLIKGNF